jgi:lipopolysaccharide/colanic/teichoic acid biosynthesis glycosyltransferase
MPDSMTRDAPRRGLPRAADVALAALGLVVFSPVLLVAAVAIKLGSRGPIVYRQLRTGRGGETFELWKLRTMKRGSDPVGVGTAVVADDPRVTGAGKVLRRLALDEVPNLVNVLRGEMAIVGPRATLPAQTDLYTERQRRRLELKPGITGWSQTHGRAGIPWEERIEQDVWYVEHRSLGLDLRILALTPLVVMRGTGFDAPDAYAGAAEGSPLRQAAERETQRTSG